MADEGDILVTNAGPSSIKLAPFTRTLDRRLDGLATEIGGAARLTVGDDSTPADLPDHGAGGPALHAKGAPITAWIVPAREERPVAADALSLMEP